MSKMTPEKKALNKAATVLRNVAYRNRRAEYDGATSAARQSVESSPLGAAWDAARGDLDAATEGRAAAVKAIQDQIDALRAQFDGVMEVHGRLVNAAKARRDSTSVAFHAALNEQLEAIETKYADMKGVWGPGTWKSLDEFLNHVPGGPVASASLQPSNGEG